MDTLTSAQRSVRMSLVKSANTQPEWMLRRLVHGLGFRYRVHPHGVVGRPDVKVTTDSETLMGLSSVPLKFGLPDVMSKAGREVNRKLLEGKLKVKGLLLHPVKLGRLNKLLSVVEGS